MERSFKRATGNFPATVNWEETETIEGTIVSRKAQDTQNGPRQVMTIATPDGHEVAVWESAGLNSLFALHDGYYVRITNEGKKVNPKTKRTFRSFMVEYDDTQAEPF